MQEHMFCLPVRPEMKVLMNPGQYGKVGPQILQDPKEYFNLCWIAGLLPRNMDHLATGIPVQLQRDALLTVALENNMVGFLIASITVWSEGGFSSGCTLRTILDWAWNKVASIKESIDRVCMPLYDGYGTHLDKQSTQLLDQHALHLNHMVLISRHCWISQGPPLNKVSGLFENFRDTTCIQCGVC
ncbi:protein ELYS-like [Ptychodera flava]|uniref:protein ELYS-like n=1 Tax=Ptychodera flava TaxID=63121 RepID=UPI003969CA46